MTLLWLGPAIAALLAGGVAWLEETAAGAKVLARWIEDDR
jgi:hypothetical protein